MCVILLIGQRPTPLDMIYLYGSSEERNSQQFPHTSENTLHECSYETR